jgi:hypothetical protein
MKRRSFLKLAGYAWTSGLIGNNLSVAGQRNTQSSGNNNFLD